MVKILTFYQCDNLNNLFLKHAILRKLEIIFKLYTWLLSRPSFLDNTIAYDIVR